MDMEGDPRHFESIGNRLGFRIAQKGAETLYWVWCGARFPGLLCLGISLGLLFLAVPIVEAIRLQGLSSRVGSLWYFPLMNLVLLGVAVFLLSLKRTVVLDRASGKVFLTKRSVFGRRGLVVDFAEVVSLRLGTDQVYSGFAVAGSTAGVKSFPAASLRLLLSNGETVLLDRGGRKRLGEMAERMSVFIGKPVTVE
ncbi:MAG: hypothetical protein ACREP8_05680 [Candidatus Binatia bacterium]